ncbi:MAG: TRAP transporter small permease [Betaproteobacteria bacterium]|nr:TRAP transporter small permease [Betaproteobacteria bacterium]
MMRILKSLSAVFAMVGAAFALVIGAMTTWSVIGRALFQAPVQGDVEMVQMGIALSLSLCLPWCQWRGGNILVDFFTQHASEKTVARLDAVGCVMLTLMYAVLSWRSAVGAADAYQSFEATMILGLPMWWAYACLSPGLALAALVSLCQAWQLALGRSMSDLQGEISA